MEHKWVRKPKIYTSIDSATRPMSSSVHGMGLQAQVRYFTKWVLTNPKPPPPHRKFEACEIFSHKRNQDSLPISFCGGPS